MSSITVYKASAGSGKTFTLALEYIKFLIYNPESYRNILAVTFTNKATEEMKNRITGKLYSLANNLEDSKDYFDKLRTNRITDEDIRINAHKALSLLIHNYDYFHVETIDTFFQSVLRNLAKELDLSANLRIELNDKMVEEKAVDTMIEELDRTSPLFSWLISFIMNNIDENKGWNVIRSVKDFGRMIFNDNYKDESKNITKQLQKKDFISEYQKKLRKMRNDSKSALCEIKDNFFCVIKENNIEPTDFKGGARTGIQRYFYKLSDDNLDDKKFMPATVAKCIESPENWTTKSNAKKDIIKSLAGSTLIPMLENAEKARHYAQYTIQSVDATLKNINSLKLLNDIEKKVREMNVDANRFLLSDTQNLLRSMIKDTDSPFIFEKIGTWLDHIMIDEFQDTSSIQWKNFLILINECISRCSEDDSNVNNLIVGDVKQSIYRWRSGDWQLLNNINKFFKNSTVETKELKVNYRSKRNIVIFNNTFFKYSIKVESLNESEIDKEEALFINEAYKDVEQIPVKKDEEGLVRIKLLSKDDYTNKVLGETEVTIDEILEKGTPQNKIAILLRSNKYIPLIANYFMERRPDISIVSDEAFKLDRSSAVMTIVAAMKYISNPNDRINKMCLIKNCSQNDKDKKSVYDKYIALNDLTGLLPEEFVNDIEELKKLPLYELAERLFIIFNLESMQNESAYICAFYDALSNYISNMSSDLAGFLKEWDENIHSNTIQTDGVGGIRLISIHKSKGLEFDNVIIPFCDWNLENYSSNYIWCRPQEKPYNELPLIPLNYSPKLANSVYYKDYRHEHLQTTIDNLNLLYVAFTRAANNLFVIGKRDTKNTRSALIQSCLCNDSLLSLPESILKGEENSDSDIFYEFGSFAASKETDEQSKKEIKNTKNGVKTSSIDNIFMRESISVDICVKSHIMPITFRQSNKSKDFTADITGGDEQQSRNYIKFGNILHLIFSKIHTADDIPMVLDEFEANGVLYEGDLNRIELEKKLRYYISSDKQIADWFSTRWKLYNECTVLSLDEEKGKSGRITERRPDRVMRDGNRIIVVDFKFGNMHKEYIDQVKGYLEILKKMGYDDVKGYLWFVLKKQVVPVEL